MNEPSRHLEDVTLISQGQCLGEGVCEGAAIASASVSVMKGFASQAEGLDLAELPRVLSGGVM